MLFIYFIVLRKYFHVQSIEIVIFWIFSITTLTLIDIEDFLEKEPSRICREPSVGPENEDNDTGAQDMKPEDLDVDLDSLPNDQPASASS